MIDLLIIAPLSVSFSGIRNFGDPPLGTHRLASYIKSKGMNVKVYDCNIHTKEYLDDILKQQPNVIGISILNDTLILSLEMFLDISKKCPDSLLVAGGAEATLNYQEILDNTDVNAVITGEGEDALFDICLGESLSSIRGVITRRYNKPITDERLWEYTKNLNFRDMGYREYWSKRKDVEGEEPRKVVRMHSSSHCLRGCSFCSVTRVNSSACGKVVKPAKLNNEQIKQLLSNMVEQLPETQGVYFSEDSILPTKDRIDDFCLALKEFKDKLYFLVQTETMKVDEDIIRKLSEVNVNHISFGVENCSPRIRKLMNKPQDSQQIENIIKWCNKYGIRCYYLIILFSPESNMEDLRINYETLTRWQNECDVTVSIEPFLMPYRGASIWYEDYPFDYKITKLSNRKKVKHPYIAYPKDKEVRAVLDEFKEKLPFYIEAFSKREGHDHISKDLTGTIMIELLGDLL